MTETKGQGDRAFRVAIDDKVYHIPVMLEEVLGLFSGIKSDALVLDCTVGAGGHALAILSKFPNCRYIGLDADPSAIERTSTRLEPYSERVELVQGFFDEVLSGFEKNEKDERPRPDFILFDLGLSMHQFADSGRGFSFANNDSLDMRISASLAVSAADIVNSLRENELADIIYNFGDEKYSRRIARAIIEARRIAPIRSASRLSEIISGAVPAEYRHGRIHPATRTFQALRIEVNSELEREGKALRIASRLLAPNGVLAVISFHSLEDRIAKTVFRELCQTLGYEKLLHKPAVPSEAEIEANPASRSAKLRAVRAPKILILDTQVVHSTQALLDDEGGLR
jgi:16S rRNA (cytosine1402-N4)-methyltransferase